VGEDARNGDGTLLTLAVRWTARSIERTHAVASVCGTRLRQRHRRVAVHG